MAAFYVFALTFSLISRISFVCLCNSDGLINFPLKYSLTAKSNSTVSFSTCLKSGTGATRFLEKISTNKFQKSDLVIFSQQLQTYLCNPAQQDNYQIAQPEGPSGLQHRAPCVRYARSWVMSPEAQNNDIVAMSANTCIKKAQLPCWPLYSQQVSH